MDRGAKRLRVARYLPWCVLMAMVGGGVLGLDLALVPGGLGGFAAFLLGLLASGYAAAMVYRLCDRVSWSTDFAVWSTSLAMGGVALGVAHLACRRAPALGMARFVQCERDADITADQAFFLLQVSTLIWWYHLRRIRRAAGS